MTYRNNKENDHTPSDGSGDIAVIGEGTPNRTPVSLQVLQNIYHELTGRTEQVSKSYSESFKVVQSDLEQLDNRIRQALEQYNIQAETHQFTVFYLNDTQDRFSSFDRFRAFNAGSASAVESIVFKYNFMVLLPKLQQPQGYTLTIRIASQAAIAKKMKSDFFQLPKILKLMGGRTAVVNVEYVDYLVARNLLDIVDGWFKSLSTSSVSPVFDFIRKRTSYIPLISKYVIGLFVVYLIYESIPVFLQGVASFQQFAYFALISFSGLFTAYKLAEHLGSAAEDAIDRWDPISYVQLTAGDKKLIGEHESANKTSLKFAILNLVGSFIVGVAARVVASWLTSTPV